MTNTSKHDLDKVLDSMDKQKNPLKYLNEDEEMQIRSILMEIRTEAGINQSQQEARVAMAFHRGVFYGRQKGKKK